ncbi:TPA: hypothetical protein JAV84_001059 [Enterobacter asburiae]|nr:hypothetical protein [Enterobacter asburiae]HAT7508319.1 hypothetical protein [Enterobacter asburiae]
MAITSAFQADDAGSIPAARSSLSFSVCDDGVPGVTEKRPSFEWALLFAKLLCENTDLWVQRSSKSISLKSS